MAEKKAKYEAHDKHGKKKKAGKDGYQPHDKHAPKKGAK